MFDLFLGLDGQPAAPLGVASCATRRGLGLHESAARGWPPYALRYPLRVRVVRVHDRGLLK